MKNNSKRLPILRILLTVLLAVFLITPNITEAASVTVTQGKTKEYTVYSTGETFQVNLENAYTGTSFQGGPSWITWSGSGSSYTLTAPRNGSGSYREGYVTFRDGDRTWTVKVKQYAAVDLTVSVKFDYNGGNANIGNHTYTVGARYEYLPVGPTPPTGHKFDGWYTAPSGGTRITEYSTVSEAYKTLYAQYSLRDYTVSFNSNGGSWVANKTVKYNNYYGDLPFPSRTYYTFQGWYTDPSGGNQITSSSVFNVAADQTLYAHWTRDTVTVTFNSNGGSGNIGNKTYNVGDRYGSLPAGFTPPKGFTFDGWYTAATGGSKMTAESIAYASYSTLYAHYVPNTYKVSYDGQGGSGASPVNVVYGNTYGSAYTSGSLPEPIKGNHTFLGWYTEAEGGSKITSSTKVSIAANQTLYAHWRRNTVSVSFDNNGGSGTIGSRSYGIGIAYGTLPAGPTPKKGYSFDGWYTAASGGNKITENTTVSATLTVLYAHYKANTYTISFNSQGGTSVSQKTVTYDAKHGTFTSPTRTGYTFQGWYTEKEGGNRIIAESKVTIAANRTLYAHWKANIYPVTFSSQGGTAVSSKNVTYDSTYGTLTTPAKTGYDFQGWYTAASGGTKITASSTVKITQPLTLYAQWKGKTISVSFNVNGGSGTVPSRSYVVGDKYSSLPTKPTEPSGYGFTGWFTAKSGGTKITTTSSVLYEAKTLYAQYSPKEYTVTFDSQCGISVNTKKVTYDSKYGTLSTLVRTGYIFDGWYTTPATGGSKVTSETIVKTAGNHKLYARWTPRTYTVGFNSQGGAAVTSINVVYNRTYGTLPTPTKVGHNFDGWFTAKSGGDKVTSGTKVQITANQTLYAQWTPKTMTVKFAANGGTAVDAISVTYGKKYGTLPSTTRTGYLFQGWFTEKEEGSKVTKDSTVTATGTHTLYAHWKANTYVVNFFTDGGTTVDNKNVTYDSAYGTLVSPGKDGYTFKGWFTEKTGGTQVKSTTIVKTAKSHTLYAHWEGKAVSIKFDVNQGSGTVPNKACVVGEKYGSLPAGPTSPTGHSFEGWYTAKSGGTKITESTIVAPSHKVLYAHYKANKYTVTYNTDGGSTVPSVQVTYGSTYGSAYSDNELPTPRKPLHIFSGWYTAKTGGNKVNPSTKMTIAANHTLYAHWTPAVLVKFDVNGGNGGVDNIPSKEYTIGSTYGSFPVNPTPPSTISRFSGWYTEKKGGEKITINSTVSASITTLYAHYVVDVTFDYNGGTGNISDRTYTLGTDYGSLPAGPTRADYEFVCWRTGRDSGIKVEPNMPVSSTEKIFYASWKLKNPAAYNGSYDNFSAASGKKYAHNFYSNPIIPGQTDKYDGFYIEFKAEDAAWGTYWALCNWNMNLDNETEEYTNSYGTPFGAYAGFQVLDNGNKALIFSVWDGVRVSDNKHQWVDFVSSGFSEQEYSARNERKSGEGSYTQYLFDYNWSSDKWYGMYLASEIINGEAHVSMYIYDISATQWTHVVTVNTHLKDSHMEGSMGMFMENYHSTSREALRSCKLRNVWIQPVGQKMTEITTFRLSTDSNVNKLGSFAFNSYGNYIWAYTTGYGPNTYNTVDRYSVDFKVTISPSGSHPTFPK